MVDKRYLKGIKLGEEIRMLLSTTEMLPEGEAFDRLSADQAAAFFVRGQRLAVEAIGQAAPEIARGAQAMAAAVRSGGSLVYAAAGSSGLMALADACELPGTFGIPADTIQIHMAGGVPADGRMPGGTEDDTEAADVIGRGVAAGDVVIVLSASGTTPFALAVAEVVKSKGSVLIAIASNPGSPLLELADIPICLQTPPEVIAGSTRLGAGTAQKAALNLMSSLMGIALGHVYQGQMVNVVADNTKLINRAVGIIAGISNVSEAAAKTALDQSGGDTKAAILVAAGVTLKDAKALLSVHIGHLEPCFNSLKSNQDIKV